MSRLQLVAGGVEVRVLYGSGAADYLFGAQRGQQPPPGLELASPPPFPSLPASAHPPSPRVAGTSKRGAEPADGAGSMARVTGVAAAAIAAVLDLSVAHHGCSPEVRATFKKTRATRPIGR